MKNLPGFTAEASLYKTAGHYHKTGNFTQTHGAIYPTTIADLLWSANFRLPPWFYSLFCCSFCRDDCNRICPDSECYRVCLDNCTNKCNAYAFGGCRQLLGL